ncbi:hypothetical protein G7Y89_g9572 [Cudoniella acicularis]|uniref:Xylanolytic transcriptional activator regulatory domain-containing protein n=1 Tax=Cudoniella acicularis TaxID=354080 RepID=A0A8H4RH21_9HELO|nr:hypothetical protein G7Y89_g9572 [Cudoniella acicularis]
MPPLRPAIRNSQRPSSAQDWEDQRTTFERLYVTENKALREVAEIMERDHGFLATHKTLPAFGYAKSNGYFNSTLGIFRKIENHDSDLPSLLSKPASSRADNSGLREKYKSFIRQLPSKPYIENLLITFFREVNYEYYPLDEAIFRDHLKSWHNLTFSTLNRGSLELSGDLRFFPALLFQILALALQFQPLNHDSTLNSLKYSAGMSFDDLATDYSESGVEITLLLEKQHNTLVTVQAGFLRTVFLRNCGMVTESWHSLSQTIRDAQEIGLHKNTGERPPNAKEQDDILENLWLEQLQRRLWLILSIWDIQMAVALGHPTTIDSRDRGPAFPLDAPIPKNRREEAPSARSGSDPPTPLTMFLWMSELSAPLWDILNLEKEDPHQSNFDKVEKMHELIRQLMMHCPPLFRADDPDTTFDSHLCCYWLPRARPNFQTTLAFTIMALHRPYIFTSISSRTLALKAGLDILRAQRTFFNLLTATHYKMFSLVLNNFDAIVLVAAIYILYPHENIEDLDDALQHFEWGMERFSVMSGRNSMAKSALGVLKATYVRLKKALDPSRTRKRSLPPTAQSASSVSMTRSSRLQASASCSSPNQQHVHKPQQQTSINNYTSTQHTQPTISNDLEPTLALSSAWEAFSGSMSIPPDFDFSSMTPLQPMHDLLYNDLSTIGDSQMVDPLLVNMNAGIFDTVAPSGTEMWQFEGDFGTDSFWKFMNTL